MADIPADPDRQPPAAAAALDLMVRKFRQRSQLDKQDVDALYRLPAERRQIDQHRYIVREGERPPGCAILLAGLAYRQKLTVDGARQILSVHIPGDPLDLEGSLLKVSDHNIQALTACEVAIIPRPALIELIDTRPRVARAMWIDTLIDGSIFREWIVNVGRRDAKAGLSHLLCEFARRLEVAGMGGNGGYELPMTQEQLADAMGLTPVHVNRVLKELEQDGLIVRERRFVRIPSWERLRDVAGFNERYLHLQQLAGG